MGQYYKYLIIDKDGVKHTRDSWTYDSGMKLMEHSWVGNSYVNSALTQIFCNPCQVAWVGDYSENGSCVYNGKEKDFNEYYYSCYNKYNPDTQETEHTAIKEDETILEEDLVEFDTDNHSYYLINHTKHTYIDLDKYVKENSTKQHGRYYGDDGQIIEKDFDMCINPLPLLTACGNGQGGGDYRGSSWTPNDEWAVGSWALDLIELTEDIPFGYEEVEYYFKED